MTEFKKEFIKEFDRKFNNTYPIPYAQITEHFKDWQPPKKMREIPKSVADFIKSQDLITLSDWDAVWKLIDSRSLKWLSRLGSNGFEEKVHTLCDLKINGYTVKPEQLYHVEFPKISEVYLNLRTDTGDVVTGNKDEFGLYKTKFTEQEIKEIDQRYWAFAVKVEG